MKSRSCSPKKQDKNGHGRKGTTSTNAGGWVGERNREKWSGTGQLCLQEWGRGQEDRSRESSGTDHSMARRERRGLPGKGEN